MERNFRRLQLQFGVGIWSKYPQGQFELSEGGRWAFVPPYSTRWWILAAELSLAVQCSQLGSEWRHTILKSCFTDCVDFTFNQMNLLFKKHISKAQTHSPLILVSNKRFYLKAVLFQILWSGVDGISLASLIPKDLSSLLKLQEILSLKFYDMHLSW